MPLSDMSVHINKKRGNVCKGNTVGDSPGYVLYLATK